MVESVKKQLISNQKSLAIWGVGYLGYTNIVNYACRGIKLVATDFLKTDRMNLLKSNKDPRNGFQSLLNGFHLPEDLLDNVTFESDHVKILQREDIAAHILCLPRSFHRQGLSDDEDVFTDFLIQNKSILEGRNLLFIIESLMAPGRTESDVVDPLKNAGLECGKDFSVCIATRRDWNSQHFDQHNARFIAGTDALTVSVSSEILSLVCPKLVEAGTIREAELASNVEHSLTHLQITYINQICTGYPEMDVRGTMEKLSSLTGKEFLSPSLGTGGFKLPVSSMNILNGASHPEDLTLLQETIYTDFSMHEQAISFIRSKKAASVGILGLSYKPDEKSEEYSPVMKIIEGLAKEGISVRVNDPNYTAEEIEAHTGAAAFSFPEGLEDFDLILLFTGHTDYRAVSWERLSACCKAKWILDNTDSWSSFPWESLGATCNVVGGADWRG